MAGMNQWWPLAGLRLLTPRLELRLPVRANTVLAKTVRAKAVRANTLPTKTVRADTVLAKTVRAIVSAAVSPTGRDRADEADRPSGHD